jgi:hypothetical protein
MGSTGGMICHFLSGYEDVWDLIFSFIGGSPWRDHYLSLLLVNRHFYQIVQRNDEFIFFFVRAFAKKKTRTVPKNFPSLSFLLSRRGRYLCKYFSCPIDQEAITCLVTSGCNFEVLKQLLKTFQWRVEDVEQLVHCGELAQLAFKCRQIISILSALNEMALSYSEEIQNLLNECIDFCNSAYFYGLCISTCCAKLIKLNSKYRDIKSIVLAAVRNDGSALEFASQELRNDKDVVLTAVDNYGYALKYVSETLKNNREVVLCAVQTYGYVLQYASTELKKDRKIVLAAVQNNGYALEHASKELQDDFEIVLAAVRKYGCALKYASHKLKKNREIVFEAMKNNRYAFEYISSELQNDQKLLQYRRYIDTGVHFLYRGISTL